MDLKQGSLDAQIAKGPLAPDTVRSILRQALAALEKLHREGTVHGAIRPANLHVGAGGKVRLGEPASVETGNETIAAVRPRQAASAKYYAPEQLKADFGQVGPASDQYALGFIALELLMGPAFEALFPGVGPQDIDVEIAWMRWHSSPDDALPAVGELIPALPGDLGAVLDRMLKKHVSERYPSAAAALQALADGPRAAKTVHKKESETFAEDKQHAQGRATWQPSQLEPVKTQRAPGFAKTAWLAALLAAIVGAGALILNWPFKSDKIAVTIASSPPHAKVFLDNAPLTKATDAIYDLAPGEYTLRLELADYEPFEGKIGVGENRKIHKVTLSKLATTNGNVKDKPIVVVPDPGKGAKRVVPKTVTVRIDTVPQGALVYINGALQDGKTKGEFVVPNDSFTLKLEAPGYKGLEKRIASADELKEALVLERLRRTITLVTNPAGADVYIDEQLQDKKTNGEFEVNDAPLTVKLVHKGLTPVIRKIDKPGQLDKAIEVVFDRKVTLQSLPPGATFYVDGKEIVGKVPAVLELKPGKYQIKAVLPGYGTEEKQIEVAQARLFQDESFSLRAVPMERHALLVGVQKADDSLPSFVHAESDVEALGQALGVGGFKADKVTVLTQSRGLGMPNEAPSAANIRQHLQNLLTTNPGDVLVVALVGHAIDVPGRAFYCPAGAVLPQPNTLVSFDEVLQALAAAPARKKLLILDCWRKDWSSADKPARLRNWDKPAPPGVTILFACSKGQTGYEHPSRWHSAFGQSLVHGLLGDVGQLNVTVPALGDYCKRQVAKLMGNTIPGVKQDVELALGDGAAWVLASPGDATIDYLHGCDETDKKNIDKALEGFNRAAPKLPALADLHLRRAEAHFDKRQFDLAMADCRAALKLDPRNAGAFANLAESEAASAAALMDLAKKQAAGAPAQAKMLETQAAAGFASAEKDAAEAIGLDPGCALAHDARGAVHNARKEFTRAIQDVAEAIRLQPGLYVFYYHRAIVQRSDKQWDKALADYGEAIKRNDQKAYLFGERAEVWAQKPNLERAIEDYTQAINRDNTSYRWWQARGLLRFKTNDLDNAITDFKNATALKDAPKDAWRALGQAYFKKESLLKEEEPIQKREELLQRAVDALKMAVQIDPWYESAHYDLSVVYEALNNDKQADFHKKKVDEIKKKKAAEQKKSK